MNSIKCGDCLELIKEIPDKSIDLIVTDPPYLHVKGGMKSKKFNTGTWKSDSYMNKNLSDFDEDMIFKFLNIVAPKLKKTNMYIFCSKLQLQYYFKWIYEHKKKYDLLIWNKLKTSMKSSKFFMNDIEYILRIYEDGVSLNKIFTLDGTKADSTYYTKLQSYPQPKGVHETMKPLELIEKFIKLSSIENDTILDPFMGSGTTGVACINENRKFIGYELNEEYFNIAQNRLREAWQEKYEDKTITVASE